MSKPTKKTYRLATVVNEVREKHPSVELEISDGVTVTVPPPQLWNDELLAVAEDPVAIAKALLGDNYAAFTKAGGTAGLFAELIGDAFGDLGKFSAS